ncbi:MAG: YjjG family noncanonical pyrimidine nucleotidase [Clostridia bacterium]|nr:YjjG family noncanonical pyrimidine nucleotidase [Clostridia bacterium]
MKYTTLLFDNDNTLMDFYAAERQGIKRAFVANNIPYTEEILRHYSAVNQSFWEKYERGEIEKSEIYVGRFVQFKKETGFKFDPPKVAADYIDALRFGYDCIDGAVDLLKSLCDTYDIYIVTNGEQRTQDQRIAHSGLLPYCKGVFVSEVTGYQKPHIGYFNYVFDHINEKDKSKILMIGDSPSADIAGGKAAGLDTCFVNLFGRSCDTEPTYEITALKDFYKCLQ